MDDAIASELVLRAQEYLSQEPVFKPEMNQTQPRHHLHEDDNISLMNEIRKALHHAGIANLQSLAEMSTDELQTILEESNVVVPKARLDEILMNLRNRLFFNIAK